MIGADRLTADELRNVEEGTYLVAKLCDDEYWQQAEGRVDRVVKYDSGMTHVVIARRHESRIKVPADARKGIRVSSAASGARNLKVEGVYER